MKKVLQKRPGKNKLNRIRAEKVIKRKGDELYVKWKGYDNSFSNWINKKIYLYKMSNFPEPHTYSKSQTEDELDFCNYVTKSYLKKHSRCSFVRFCQKS